MAKEKQEIECKHVWGWKGIEYENGPIIDGLDHRHRHRLFYDLFYCVHCLEETRRQRFIRNSTTVPIPAGTVPKAYDTPAEALGEEE